MEQILRDQGWEPESNICRCGHKGGDHSSWGNRCLICEDDIFASFSEKELWANAVAALEAAGIHLTPTSVGKCLIHDPNHGPGSDWCPHCGEYAATPAPLDIPTIVGLLNSDHGFRIQTITSGEQDCRCWFHVAARKAIEPLAATPAPLDDDVRGDNQAALESLPDAVQAVDFNLPPRVIVCQHGHYWRDYGDFLSMCPVSEDNLSCSPQTVYALVPDPSLHEMDIAAYSNAETVSSGNASATPAPLDGHQTPGEFHDYRVTCAVCGEPGFLHVSWRPETWTDPGSLTAALNEEARK